MGNFTETRKFTSYNFTSVYESYDINMAMSIDNTNNVVFDTLNGNINILGSYITFRFDSSFVLSDEVELSKMLNADLISHIKAIAASIKQTYSL